MTDGKGINRMRWAARRGMLELDLILGPFVEQCYEDLSEPDKQLLERLMLSEDQDLFSWFLQRVEPDDEELQDIVKQILIFTRTTTYR
jgi:antitoxin CptB